MFIPEKTKLVKMADFFNVSVDYLLGMDNKRYIEVSDLTPEQVAHIQQIINDLREAGK